MYSKTDMKQSVLLVGQDAIDLLHRISTLDMGRLDSNRFTAGLFLNPQGKILCYFEIKKADATAVEVRFEDSFLEILDQYTFAEKYEIRSLPPPPGDSALAEKNRIEALTPKLGHEFLNNAETNPLEVNLKSAIHENKGCYPGQEVIEKIISLGSPARKLVLLDGNTDEILPTFLYDPATNAAVGTLTSAADGVALAIVKRTHLQTNTFLKTQNAVFNLKKVQ
jgi:folate-binding protein YgfZ